MFYSKSLVILAPTLRSLIHFELSCIWTEVAGPVNSFECEYPVILALFVVNTVFPI